MRGGVRVAKAQHSECGRGIAYSEWQCADERGGAPNTSRGLDARERVVNTCGEHVRRTRVAAPGHRGVDDENRLRPSHRATASWSANGPVDAVSRVAGGRRVARVERCPPLVARRREVATVAVSMRERRTYL
jgi:hypothetical protein